MSDEEGRMNEDEKKAFELWRDGWLYGFSAVDADGNRVDPATIQPTSFPLAEPPEDMPTKDEIEARNEFHKWSHRHG